MALPTTKQDLKRLLDSMQAQGASKDEMKFIIDSFVSEQKKKTDGQSVPSFMGRAAEAVSDSPDVRTEIQERATGVEFAEVAEVTPEMQEEQERREVLEERAQFATAPLGTLAVDTLKTAASGLQQAAGGVKQQALEMVGKDEQPETVGEGFTDIVQGAIQTVFSPIAAVVQNLPGGEKVAEIAGIPRELVGDLYDVVANKAGVDLSSTQAQEAREQVMSAFDVGTFLAPAAISKIKPKASGALKASAAKDVSQVLSPTKVKTKTITQGLLKDPDAIKKLPFATTRGKLIEKVKTELDSVGTKFDEFEVQGGVQGSTEVALLDEFLESKKADFMVEGVVIEPKAIKAIEGLQEIVAQFDESIPNSKLRDIRRVWDETVAKSNGFTKTLAEGTELGVKKDLTNVMREELAKSNPDLAKINDEFAFYKNLETVLEEAAKRKTGQTGALTKGLAQAAGAAAGSGFIASTLGAVVAGKLVGLMNSTAWKLVSAKSKNALADALVAGDQAKATAIINKILQEPEVATVLSATQQESPELEQ